MKKTFRVKALALIFTLIAGLTVFGNTGIDQENQQIQGTWIVEGEPDNKWIITSTEVQWVINGNILKRFTYNISSETSPNGIVHKYLDLTEVGNSNSTCSYAINSLGSNKLTLETIEPKVTYTHFYKQ